MTGNKTPSHAELQNAKTLAEAYEVACVTAVSYLQMLADDRYTEFYAAAIRHEECSKQVRNLVTQYRDLCSFGDATVMLAAWYASFREVGGRQMPTVTVLRKITRLCNYLRALKNKETPAHHEAIITPEGSGESVSTTDHIGATQLALRALLVTVDANPSRILRTCYILSLARKVLMMLTWSHYSAVMYAWRGTAFGPKPRISIDQDHTDMAFALNQLTPALPDEVIKVIMFPGNEIPLLDLWVAMTPCDVLPVLRLLAKHNEENGAQEPLTDPVHTRKLVRPNIYTILAFGAHPGSEPLIPGKNAPTLADVDTALGVIGPEAPTCDGPYKTDPLKSQAKVSHLPADPENSYISGYKKGWDEGHADGYTLGYERGTKGMEPIAAQHVDHTPPKPPLSLTEVQRFRRQLQREAKARHLSTAMAAAKGSSPEQLAQAEAYLTHVYGKKVGLSLLRSLSDEKLIEYANKQVNRLYSGITPVPHLKDRNIAYPRTTGQKEPDFGIDLDSGDKVKLTVASDFSQLKNTAAATVRSLNQCFGNPGIVGRWQEIAERQSEACRQAILTRHEQTRQLGITEYPWPLWACGTVGAMTSLVSVEAPGFYVLLVFVVGTLLTMASAGRNKAGK